MFLQQKLEELKGKYQDAFQIAQTISEIRDKKIIEGFINQTTEEYAFNEFYNNGNEDVLRYAGVVMGLKKMEHPYFKKMTREYAEKVQSIQSMVFELTYDNKEHQRIFTQYELGAEYCLHDYIEEELKYSQLDKRHLYQEILNKGASLSIKRDTRSKEYKEFQKLLLAGDAASRSVKTLLESMDNEKYFQKNAFYAMKRFLWMHEKGAFDNMTERELKIFYNSQVRMEKRNKAKLEKGEFRLDDDSQSKTISLSS